MMLRPGELLGLPAGTVDVVTQVAALRYVLVGLALLWAALVARSRPAVALIAGVVFVEAALGFWVLALGRPYGLFVDAEATRRAAEVTVAASTEGGILAGEPAARGLGTLARLLPSGTAVLFPTLLPLVVVPLVALVIRLGWRPRAPRGEPGPRADVAGMAALLWLAFGTGDLDALRGAGFVPGSWARPEASVLFLFVAAGVLIAGRLPLRGGVATAVGCLTLLPWLHIATPAPLPAGDLALLVTLDQGVWLALGVVGLGRASDPGARALVMGGAFLAAASPLLGIDTWGPHACYRLGLILAASSPLLDLAGRVGAWASEVGIGGGSREPARLGVALLLLVTVPGSFLVWWDPLRLDPVARESQDPLSPVVTAAMDWIRRETPPEAVFIASPEYAPHIAALAGRRVLRAPSLGISSDDPDRLRAERLVLSGRDAGALGARYRPTHVFVAPGDFLARGIRAPEDLETRGRLKLRRADAEGLRVYEVVAGGEAGATMREASP